jgi:hypothetical protein
VVTLPLYTRQTDQIRRFPPLYGEKRRNAGSRAAAHTPAALPSKKYARPVATDEFERPGGLLYRLAQGEFSLYGSAGTSPGTFTQMALEVDDLDAVVAELRRRGVVFEEVDLPGLQTVDGIAEIEGNYPSKGSTGERAAWFRDSEGNLLGLGQAVR